MPASAKILQLCPYLDDAHIHGGKIRANEIGSILKENSSTFEQKYLGPDALDSVQTSEFLKGLPLSLVGDVNLLFNDFAATFCPEFTPDIVVFEQPWLWREVQKLREKYPETKVIFSSHNIEYQLKELIFLDASINDGGRVSNYIRNLEKEILNSVDEVWTTCEFDAIYFRTLTDTTIRVFQNGAKESNTTEIEVSPLHNPFLLVVGSGHPPNISGIKHYLSDLDKWMIGYGKLVIVGSLATSAQEFFRNSVDNGDIVLIPTASKSLLKRLIDSCSAILLPVMYGSGTNLKTAEALVTDRKIISSETAMRGYEKFSTSTGVFVTNNAMEFKIACLGALLGPQHESYPREDSETLHWQNTLSGISETLRELMK